MFRFVQKYHNCDGVEIDDRNMLRNRSLLARLRTSRSNLCAPNLFIFNFLL